MEVVEDDAIVVVDVVVEAVVYIYRSRCFIFSLLLSQLRLFLSLLL